ncbi:MAG: hypothetical protein U0X93_08865 [Anaerolineales bacterium]
MFTVGTIVAFGSYLGQLYGALQGLAGAPVEFSTSMVSFERVFEVIDLPQDIIEKENAMPLRDVRGELEFDNVSFDYHIDPSKLLKDVKRYGRHEDVGAVLSLADKKNGDKMIKSAASPEGGRGADSPSQPAM